MASSASQPSLPPTMTAVAKALAAARADLPLPISKPLATPVPPPVTTMLVSPRLQPIFSSTPPGLSAPTPVTTPPAHSTDAPPSTTNTLPHALRLRADGSQLYSLRRAERGYRFIIRDIEDRSKRGGAWFASNMAWRVCKRDVGSQATDAILKRAFATHGYHFDGEVLSWGRDPHDHTPVKCQFCDKMTQTRDAFTGKPFCPAHACGSKWFTLPHAGSTATSGSVCSLCPRRDAPAPLLLVYCSVPSRTCKNYGVYEVSPSCAVCYDHRCWHCPDTIVRIVLMDSDKCAACTSKGQPLPQGGEVEDDAPMPELEDVIDLLDDDEEVEPAAKRVRKE